jgi:methylenetetrahydrofolate dehydrogenase (NADP+)/methenyltetrahydrofolate cyclohydrolase
MAAAVCAAVARRISEWAGTDTAPPRLATILIGDDSASAVYLAAKRPACAEMEIASLHHKLPDWVA